MNALRHRHAKEQLLSKPKGDGEGPDGLPHLFWRLISVCHNPNAGNGEETHRDPRSHTLPTSDPDLAFIVGLWDRLADQIKARLIDIIRENLPT